MRTSISDYNAYKDICLEASKNEEVFKTFKQNIAYTQILEHTSFAQGNEYLNYILKQDIDLTKLDKFKENDLQGGSTTYKYQEPFNEISPSTLRYIKVLTEIKNIFGSLDGFNICEIGTGYGGQAKILLDYFNIKEYNFVDLQEVLELNKRYLNKFEYKNLNFYTSDNLPDKEYDLVISNYAFTECSKPIQDIYLSKIIKKSKRGYLTCNHISDIFKIDSYVKEDLKNMVTEVKEKNEEPLSFNNNYILYWQ